MSTRKDKSSTTWLDVGYYIMELALPRSEYRKYDRLNTKKVQRSTWLCCNIRAITQSHMSSVEQWLEPKVTSWGDFSIPKAYFPLFNCMRYVILISWTICFILLHSIYQRFFLSSASQWMGNYCTKFVKLLDFRAISNSPRLMVRCEY